MGANTGMVPFRPNLFGGYLPPKDGVPFRPGVFQGYIVKPWYLDPEKNQEEIPGDDQEEITGDDTDNNVETGDGDEEAEVE